MWNQYIREGDQSLNQTGARKCFIMEKRYNSITFSKVLLKDNLSGKIPELEFSLLSFDPAAA